MKKYLVSTKGLITGCNDTFFVQLFRYAIVGAIAFIVDYCLLITLTEYAHIHYVIAASISFAAGLIVNYLISIRWVFKTSAISDRRIEFILFAVIGIIGLIINDITIYALTSAIGIPYWLSKLGSTVIVYFWNFIGRRSLVFGQGRNKHKSQAYNRPLS